MNSRPTIQQYRRLAEGLLRKALEAPLESKQDFIHHAMSYLAFARAQEQSNGATVDPACSDPTTSEHTDDRYLQVRQLIKQAIEIPAPDGIANFLNFSTAFRRLGIWNARMAYIQRPGARIIASEYEWKTVSRSVVPDAVPIMILWRQFGTSMNWKTQSHALTVRPSKIRSLLKAILILERYRH
jgi:hypothetical protein